MAESKEARELRMLELIKGSEIVGLHNKQSNMLLSLARGKALMIFSFENTIYWELSPFEQKNKVKDIDFHAINDIPDLLLMRYKTLHKYKDRNGLILAEIKASKGLHGVIVFGIIDYDFKENYYPFSQN